FIGRFVLVLGLALGFVAILFVLEVELLHLLPLLLRAGAGLAALLLALALANDVVLASPQLEERLIRGLLGFEGRHERLRGELIVRCGELRDGFLHGAQDRFTVLLRFGVLQLFGQRGGLLQRRRLREANLLDIVG